MKFALSRSLWHGRGGWSARRSAIRCGHLVRVRERVGQRSTAFERGVAVALDDLERVERAGDRRPAVEGAERGRDASQLLRLAEMLGRRDRTVDEARDEPSLGLDEVDDVRPDARGCRRAGRGQLDRAVDAEERGVLPGDAEDEHAVRPRDLQVVVRDAAAEHLPVRAPVGPHPRNRGGERIAHARTRSPVGSYTGSSTTIPSIHSPKISTATSVPTSCSVGR